MRKRERYRTVFAAFDRKRVAAFSTKKLETILADAGVIRHRGKIESVRSNARAIVAIAAEFGSFDAYLWGFAGVPATPPPAEALSNDLRKRGLRFVGPTIVYAFMQAVGIVNDHVTNCGFRDPAR